VLDPHNFSSCLASSGCILSCSLGWFLSLSFCSPLPCSQIDSPGAYGPSNEEITTCFLKVNCNRTRQSMHTIFIRGQKARDLVGVPTWQDRAALRLPIPPRAPGVLTPSFSKSLGHLGSGFFFPPVSLRPPVYFEPAFQKCDRPPVRVVLPSLRMKLR